MLQQLHHARGDDFLNDILDVRSRSTPAGPRTQRWHTLDMHHDANRSTGAGYAWETDVQIYIWCVQGHVRDVLRERRAAVHLRKQHLELLRLRADAPCK